MARLRLAAAEVQHTVARLVHLFFRTGSVNAMAELLSQNGIRIYPNRLHTLLSDDPNLAINESTLVAVDAALDRLHPDPTPDVTSRFKQEIHEKAWWHVTHDSTDGAPDYDTIINIAAAVGVPPAVIRSSVRSVVPSRSVPEQATPRLPDWSFQDVAYHRCRAHLAKSPYRKVGLVIPTGGGKTRVALRIVLGELHDATDPQSVVLWVTHRKRLATQARRELQAMMNAGTPELPDDAAKLLGERVKIVMLGDLADALTDVQRPAALVVIDEAHHAAAPSYLPFFEAAPPVRGLFLTATPVRTDLKAIGIDEIGFTITYRELFERNVLIEPKFVTYTAGSRQWLEEDSVTDFADYLLSAAEGDFTKTLVIASTIANVQTLHSALLRRLEDFSDHILGRDDIAWVHGEGSASGAAPDVFLDEFQARPRGILIATSSLLGEGFDDPSINAVVVTYPSTSLVNLMQVAGRCLRYYPGKTAAYVVQVVESELSYHFEQRWLYQDISDQLRPQLIDREYADTAELSTKVADLLEERNVSTEIRNRIMARISEMREGDRCSILLSGLPYDGERADFSSSAKWSAVLVAPANSDEFLGVFNEFCARDTRVADPVQFLRSYMREDNSPGSEWLTMNAMLLAMQYARRELVREPYSGAENRDYRPNRGTTWLTYVTFNYHPQLPLAVREFLAPCVNRDEITASYLANRAQWELALRLELPLAGSLAWLLTQEQATAFAKLREDLVARVRLSPMVEAFSAVAAGLAAAGPLPLPYIVSMHIDRFLGEDAFATRTLDLRHLNGIMNVTATIQTT